ncbi:MAG: aryl-sulfate sulfotransferase [Pseudomonadota bacterium]
MRPELRVITCDPARHSLGVVLLTVGNGTRAVRKTSPCKQVIAISQEGKLVWRQDFDFCLVNRRRSRRDTVLIMGTGGVAREIDRAGRVLHTRYAAGLHASAPDGVRVDTLKFHHSICELADGTLCSLSLEWRPLDDLEEIADHVMLDTVVIWHRDGTVLRKMSLAQVCDITHVSHDWDPIYYSNQGWPRTKDWSQGNCVIEDPADGGFLMSFCHQDSVTKVSRAGELEWIMGGDASYRPVIREKLLKMDWQRPFWHPHDISFNAAGNLLILDKSKGGAFSPDPKPPIETWESHALTFRIDVAGRTAPETWRHGGAGKLPFSLCVGSVCEMPNGNRLIACSGLSHTPVGCPAARPTLGIGAVELVEATPAGAEVVRARIDAALGDPMAGGWNGFRPEFLAPDPAPRLGQP